MNWLTGDRRCDQSRAVHGNNLMLKEQGLKYKWIRLVSLTFQCKTIISDYNFHSDFRENKFVFRVLE